MSTEKAPYRPIPCVVCDRPLPVLRDGEENDPGYFPASSSGYKAGDEGERACEDLSQLLRYMQTVNSAVWEKFSTRDLAKRVNAMNVDGLELPGAHQTFSEARDLCFLYSELLEEAKRRFHLLDTWVDVKFVEEQRTKGAGVA